MESIRPGFFVQRKRRLQSAKNVFIAVQRRVPNVDFVPDMFPFHSGIASYRTSSRNESTAIDSTEGNVKVVYFCHSERSEESLFVSHPGKREIPRRAARLGMTKL
jgi:hypothetical protein